jgi:hypothetical protein
MNRKQKYKLNRFIKRVSFVKSACMFVLSVSLFLFSFGFMATGSYSYFNAQVNVTNEFTNAVKEELVTISRGEVIYEDKCIAKLPITIKNIFDFLVIVSIGESKYNLQPGEEITHVQIVANGCNDFGDKNIEIVGYVHYFSHLITVNVDKEKLNPCPPASENGQGKPNDNGEGKHCGNNGIDERDNQVTDSTNNNQPEANTNSKDETNSELENEKDEVLEEVKVDVTEEAIEEKKEEVAEEAIEEKKEEVAEEVIEEGKVNNTDETSKSTGN